MFTGIVERMGRTESVSERTRARRLALHATGFENLAIGDSLAVNGVCLTIVDQHGPIIEFDVVEETLERSTLGCLKSGDRVNLERPLRLDSLLGGHLVQGHADGVGVVRSVEDRGAEKWLEVTIPRGLSRYVVEKGSIALDGVSLTVATVDAERVSVAIIPHTAAVTTLGGLSQGSSVNVEVDVVAKHLEKLAAPYLAGLSARSQ